MSFKFLGERRIRKQLENLGPGLHIWGTRIAERLRGTEVRFSTKGFVNSSSLSDCGLYTLVSLTILMLGADGSLRAILSSIKIIRKTERISDLHGLKSQPLPNLPAN